MTPLVFLSPDDPFPSDLEATNRDGVLAIGGNYSVAWLTNAYRLGLFPMESYNGWPLWWNPDPRFVLLFPDLKLPRSMRPLFNRQAFRVTYDKAFQSVILACALARRKGNPGTWITQPIVEGYLAMHEVGLAHSVEVWNHEGLLVGGLYGIALGKVFFGESMFSEVSNASKYGFLTLATDLYRKGYWMIDCQMPTQYLGSLGAAPIARSMFISYMQKNAANPSDVGTWEAPDPQVFNPLKSELFLHPH